MTHNKLYFAKRASASVTHTYSVPDFSQFKWPNSIGTIQLVASPSARLYVGVAHFNVTFMRFTFIGADFGDCDTASS